MIGGLYDLYNLLLVIDIIMIVRNMGEIFNIHFIKMELVSILIALIISLITYFSHDFNEG